MRQAQIASTSTNLAAILAQLRTDRATKAAAIADLGQRLEQLDAAIAAMTPLVAPPAPRQKAAVARQEPASRTTRGPKPRSGRVTSDGLSRDATLVVDALRKAGTGLPWGQVARAAGVPVENRTTIRRELLAAGLLTIEGRARAATWSLAHPTAPAKEVP